MIRGVQLKPFPATAKLLQKLKDLGQKGLLREADVVGSVTTITELALEAAKKSTPGPGKLRGMWGLTRWHRADFIRWTLRNSAADRAKGRDILGYLEFGTRPHVIMPKNAQALRFLIGNSPVFAKKVFHPGTKPYAMFANAENVVVDKLTELFNNIGKKVDAATKV